MAQSIVPLVIVLLASSLALSNAIGSGYNNVFCQDKADGMYADPSDSHYFYHCSNSLTYHKQCPATLVFNSARNRCDWDVAGNVAAVTTQGANKPLVNSVFCQGKADGLYANPLNSHTFYQCSNSLTYLKSCPSTLVFNPAICVCDWPVLHDDATAVTQGITKSQYVVDFCKAKVDGMFADPGNSNAFYHCSNHYTFYKLCQQGLVFNQRLGACVWPSQGV
ncbi:chondroitin proteoglycan 2-like [Lampetra planeri]